MPIDPVTNKILKQMWEIDELLRGYELNPSQVEFYNTNLNLIKEYYRRNAEYWLEKEPLTGNSDKVRTEEEILKESKEIRKQLKNFLKMKKKDQKEMYYSYIFSFPENESYASFDSFWEYKAHYISDLYIHIMELTMEMEQLKSDKLETYQ